MKRNRCNETFHPPWGKKGTFSFQQQQTTLQSLSQTQIITAGPIERYLGQKALFKGSSSPSVTYSSIIQETEETVT